MIELHKRRDQFAYFLGFAAKTKNNQLSEALTSYSEQGYELDELLNVFECCPFNDNLEQILRSFHISESGKQADLALNLARIIDEFVFLLSDYAPDCCDDGRLTYCLSDAGLLCMECDRCSQVYDLDGNVTKITNPRKMMQNDFAMRYGSATAADWPYHNKLKALSLVA